jgi:hypothetical protein
MSAEIKRLVAPVVAMLRHDVARPTSPVLDKAFALEQLQQVLDIVNDKPSPAVTTITETEEETRILRGLLQENLQRRD